MWPSHATSPNSVEWSTSCYKLRGTITSLDSGFITPLRWHDDEDATKRSFTLNQEITCKHPVRVRPKPDVLCYLLNKKGSALPKVSTKGWKEHSRALGDQGVRLSLGWENLQTVDERRNGLACETRAATASELPCLITVTLSHHCYFV